MPKPIRLFVKYVDALNYYIGRFAMYLFFALGACLLYSTFSRVVLGVPVNWVLEMSQFLLSAYYLLGGAYAMQQGAHVRMDLFFDRLPPRRKMITDMITILFGIFYLGVDGCGRHFLDRLRHLLWPEKLHGLGTAPLADQTCHDRRHLSPAAAMRLEFPQGLGVVPRETDQHDCRTGN
jgi:hypothetical protein